MSEESGLPRLAGRIRRWLHRDAGGRRVAGADAAPPVTTGGSAAGGVAVPAAGAPPIDLTALDKQIAKLGREQFRLNALMETQYQKVQAHLQRLQEQAERRDRDWTELLAQRDVERAEARLQVVERLLPVLDGLDEALATGQKLLESIPLSRFRPPVKSQGGRRSLGQDLLAWAILLLGQIFPGLLRPSPRRVVQGAIPATPAWKESYLAWLRGLELVRERLLGVLAAESVWPVETCGCIFDPYRHRALGTAPAGHGAPAGTVVAELRRGYVLGDRVLRYAEVIVARATEPSPRPGDGEPQNGGPGAAHPEMGNTHQLEVAEGRGT